MMKSLLVSLVMCGAVFAGTETLVYQPDQSPSGFGNFGTAQFQTVFEIRYRDIEGEPVGPTAWSSLFTKYCDHAVSSHSWTFSPNMLYDDYQIRCRQFSNKGFYDNFENWQCDHYNRDSLWTDVTQGVTMVDNQFFDFEQIGQTIPEQTAFEEEEENAELKSVSAGLGWGVAIASVFSAFLYYCAIRVGSKP